MSGAPRPWGMQEGADGGAFRWSRRRFRGRYRRAVGPVEVVALLNVLLLCGMFWMASAGWILQPGMRVRLPEGPFLDGRVLGSRVLAITREGQMFFDDECVELDGLGAALARGSGPLLVAADEWTPLHTLARVYALASEAGVEEVVLGTRPTAGPGAAGAIRPLSAPQGPRGGAE